MKLLTLITLAASLAIAQTPSGLLTGPVTYTSPLNNSPYGNSWTFYGTPPACAATSSCYIVHYVNGVEYSDLEASDGTGDCYIWDVDQLATGACQSSFHGGGSGEYGALYCLLPTPIPTDVNGVYTLNCTANWGGTAITVIDGVDTPIQTQYNVTVTIAHTPVQVWIGLHTRWPRVQTWQIITGMSVTVTPISGS